MVFRERDFFFQGGDGIRCVAVTGVQTCALPIFRTKTTAKPTADHFGITTETYGPRPDSAFIAMLKNSKKNILVVGHSNTIDDIANMLTGETVVPGDLKDSEYDNLYIIKRKGEKFVFKGERYGASSQ